MSNIQSNTKRIAFNTVFLYIRMIFLILVQLYTVPVLLKSLGVSDYGLYNVVGGIVTLFTFVGSALSSGAQRFLAFAIGQDDTDRLREVFRSTLTIYTILGIVLVVLIEPLGIWFINNKMSIPEDRIIAANCVFHFSVISFFIGLIAIPYNAAVIAHEKMSIFAYVSIFDGIAKLLAAVILGYLEGDLLIIYSVIICCISLLGRLIYQGFCKRQFEECKSVKIKWNKEFGEQLLSYAGWNTIGSLALIGRNQGINIVLNLFFGTLINAAHSLAQQISGIITQLINNVYIATRPQITKYYAQDNEEGMWKLVFSSSKWTFFLLLYIAIPAIVEMGQVLSLWLPEVPPYTCIITQIMIVVIMIETTVNQLVGAFQAKNKIRNYQVISSTILLLNIPVVYFVLRIKSNVVLPYLLMLIISLLYIISVLIIAQKDINLDLSGYLKEVWIKMVVVGVSAYSIVYLFSKMIEPCFIRIVGSVFLSAFVVSFLIYMIGCNSSEKKIIIGKIKSLIRK